MVILLHCEMDGDGHRSGRKSGLFKWVTGRSNRPSPPDHRRRSGQRELFPPTERRPLRSVPLGGPHYRVEPEILVTEFVEKETKYLGTVTDLDSSFDASDRASLLKIVDEQQALDFLPCQLSYEHDIIVSFSVHNIKLLRRDGEKLIHRIQTHKIAAVGYVRDDNQHLVFIKFASELNPKMCNLAILCCATKTAAEEVCSLAQQVFQLVYTDSTIDFLERAIMDGAITPKNHSYSTDDSDKKDAATVRSGEYPRSIDKSADSLVLSTTSQSTNGHSISRSSGLPKLPNLGPFPIPDIPAGSSSTLPQPVRRQRQHRRSGSSGSSNNLPPASAASTLTLTSPSSSIHRLPVQGEVQIQDYLRVLKEQLTKDELKEFAKLLNQYRTGGILIQQFANDVLKMYTEERKHLLLGMRPFIPNDSDLSFFNNFLKEHNVDEMLAGSSETSWWAHATRTAQRTMSETEESNTSAAGNITTVSVSSSGSERASASVVSNDDSGEWKNVIEKLRAQQIAESSTGGNMDSNCKPVNGTSSNTVVGDSSLVVEEPISQVLVAAAAAVPEGFRDTTDTDNEEDSNSGMVSSFSSIKKSPTKPASSEKTTKKLKKDARKSKSDSLQTNHPAPDHKRTQSEQSPKRTLQATSSTDKNSPPKAQSESSKSQKDHRKKKKHKKDVGPTTML